MQTKIPINDSKLQTFQELVDREKDNLYLKYGIFFNKNRNYIAKDKILDKISEISKEADTFDLPLSEYERSNKDFIEVNEKRSELASENNEIIKDIDILKDKRQEIDILKENFNKKNEFLNKNIAEIQQEITNVELDISLVCFFLRIKLNKNKHS